MPEKNFTNAKDLARHLRKLLLQREPGEFFGLEDTILETFRISRPTLRQAARVLEHEELLEVKRGPGGGYFVTRPDVETVVNSASLYLHNRGTRLIDLIVAASGCLATLSALATQSRDVVAREALRLELERFRSLDFAHLPHQQYLEAEVRIMEAISRLAGNAPLDLVIRILYGGGLWANAEPIYEGRPDRMVECAELRIKEVEAILAGDRELAEIFYQRARALRMTYLEGQGQSHISKRA